MTGNVGLDVVQSVLNLYMDIMCWRCMKLVCLDYECLINGFFSCTSCCCGFGGDSGYFFTF